MNDYIHTEINGRPVTLYFNSGFELYKNQASIDSFIEDIESGKNIITRPSVKFAQDIRIWTYFKDGTSEEDTYLFPLQRYFAEFKGEPFTLQKPKFEDEKENQIIHKPFKDSELTIYLRNNEPYRFCEQTPTNKTTPVTINGIIAMHELAYEAGLINDFDMIGEFLKLSQAKFTAYVSQNGTPGIVCISFENHYEREDDDFLQPGQSKKKKQQQNGNGKKHSDTLEIKIFNPN